MNRTHRVYLWREVSFLGVFLVLFFLMHCKENETENGNNPSNPGSKGMNVNPTLSIVEIPMTKVETTISFYEKTFQTKIERMTMGNTELGVFPSDGKSVSIVLTKGEGYIPSNKGVLVYFNAGEDLQPILSSVAKNGGRVVLEKTEISPEMGYFALFMDPEGNQIGLHSKK